MDPLSTASPGRAAAAAENPRRRPILATVLSLLAAAAGGVVACTVARRLGPPPLQAVGADTLALDDFEHYVDGVAPTPPWQHETFGGVAATDYRVRNDPLGSYLHGEATAAGSLLTRAVDVDPAEYRYLRFRWRATELPMGADLRRKDGDDCALRVFVTFAYEPEHASFGERIARSLAGRELPGSSLCYVWTEGIEVGTALPNAYTDHTRMLVLQSGRAALGGWATVERDLLADYTRAFGHAPPRVTGIAIMVDADQTRSTAAADVDDLALLRQP